MTTALWIIAICEIIRLIQNTIQLRLSKRTMINCEAIELARQRFEDGLDDILRGLEKEEENND